MLSTVPRCNALGAAAPRCSDPGNQKKSTRETAVSSLATVSGHWPDTVALPASTGASCQPGSNPCFFKVVAADDAVRKSTRAFVAVASFASLWMPPENTVMF